MKEKKIAKKGNDGSNRKMTTKQKEDWKKKVYQK
jgi:hypothetical protein